MFKAFFVWDSVTVFFCRVIEFLMESERKGVIPNKPGVQDNMLTGRSYAGEPEGTAALVGGGSGWWRTLWSTVKPHNWHTLVYTLSVWIEIFTWSTIISICSISFPKIAFFSSKSLMSFLVFHIYADLYLSSNHSSQCTPETNQWLSTWPHAKYSLMLVYLKPHHPQSLCTHSSPCWLQLRCMTMAFLWHISYAATYYGVTACNVDSSFFQGWSPGPFLRVETML